MRNEVVAIGLDVELGFLYQTIGHALVDVPIGGVNGDVADAVAAFLEKTTKTVALVGGIALFKKWIAEEKRFVAIGSNDFFVLEEIHGEIGVAGGAAIVQMGIGMIADLVAGLVPGGDEFGTLGFVNAHAADEESGSDTAGVESFQDAGVGVGPTEIGFELQAR